MRALVGVCLLVGCAAPTPSRPPPIQPRPPSTVMRPPAPAVHRSVGPVKGGFELERDTETAIAPIFVHWWFENTGDKPIPYRHGGDYYHVGRSGFSWVVTNEKGHVECDLRAHPEPMAGGGGYTRMSIKPGQKVQGWLVPQLGCPALTRPGLHHLRVSHIVMPDEDPLKCPVGFDPDTTVEPADERGVPERPECLAWKKSFPAIGSDLEIEILPYEREAVRARLKRALAREDELEGMLTMYTDWLWQRMGWKPDYGKPVNVRLPMLSQALGTTPP